MDLLSTVIILVIAVGVGLLLTLPFIRSDKGSQDLSEIAKVGKTGETQKSEAKITRKVRREKHD